MSTDITPHNTKINAISTRCDLRIDFSSEQTDDIRIAGTRLRVRNPLFAPKLKRVSIRHRQTTRGQGVVAAHPPPQAPGNV